MNTVDFLDPALRQWHEWSLPLSQFSKASGFVVSLYDVQGGRQLGPFMSSRTAGLLETSTLWSEQGRGTLFERRMVATAVAAGSGEEASFCDGLRVCSLPLSRFGKIYGVLIFGWVFRDFSSPFACEQLARQIGLGGHLLWAEVRMEPPVSDARMATYTALLTTLVNSIDGRQETIEQLNQVSRTRDLFLATVSHEMRTPLSALSMRLELMLRSVPDLPPAVTLGLTAMRKHVQQEAVMIDDLIDAARTLTGQMSVIRTRVDLAQILQDAIMTIEVNAAEKAIAVHVAPLEGGATVMIEADAKRMQQVLWNLLYNAIKFTPKGGSIEISVKREPGWIVIEVADSGQGIDAADIPLVFGAFTLQKQANPNGLGLGLFIARRIVELHGGALTVTSAGADLGTTFSIRLPD
ncbi:MAG: HAMP domain-containing sensor histidine kinase [Pseudomonadota bacterium]